MKEGNLCEWTFERIREACEKVAMGDTCRLSIGLEIPAKKHGFLEEHHRTSRRNGRSHIVVCLPALQLLPFG